MAQEMDCLTPKTQVELTVCAGQDWMAADTDLNDA